MKSACVIQPLGSADLPSLLAMMRALYAHEKIAFDETRQSRVMGHFFSDPRNGTGWIALRDGAPCGYLFLTWCFSIEFGGIYGLVDELFVDPQSRGGGIGSKLLDTAARHCENAGVAVMRLEVDEGNPDAVRLYSRHGFRREYRHLMTRR